MRIRHLELSGIGPFPSRHSIDFDPLTAGGLFLLEGPTGSGKSTIIDAVTWALYGTVAGGKDSTDERMRSIHCDPRKESYVDLIFSVEAGTFRVRRTPQWIKYGNKTATNATAKLWRLSEEAYDTGRFDAGEVLETRASEVGKYITQLVGLNREQFVQTIVLPQGKFAEFLRLDSAKRTALLEQIFDTSVYRRVTEELKRKANEARESLDKAKKNWEIATKVSLGMLEEKEEASSTFSTFNSTAQPGIATSSTQLSDKPENKETISFESIHTCEEARSSMSFLAQKMNVLVSRISELKKQATQAKRAFDKASSAQEKAQRLIERIEQREKLLTEEKELATREKSIAEYEETLTLHREAAAFLPLIDSYETALLSLKQADKNAREAGADEGTQLTNERAAQEKSITLIALLESCLSQEHSLGKMQERASLTEEKIREHSSRIEKLSDKIVQLPEHLATLTDRYTRIEKAARSIPDLENRLQDLKTKQEKYSSLTQAQEKEKLLEHSLSEALASFKKASDKRERLNSAWIVSAAGNLASSLEENMPCPVCGSSEHPSPAPFSDENVNLDDIAEADRETDAARSTAENIRIDLVETQTLIRSLKEDLSEVDTALLPANIATTLAEIEQSREASTQIETLKSLILKKKEELEKVHADHATCETDLLTWHTQLSEIQTNITETQQSLAPALQDFPSIEARLAEVSREHEQRKILVERLEEREKAHVTLIHQEKELEKALDTSSFSGPTDVKASLLEKHLHDKLVNDVETYRASLIRVHEALSSPEIQELEEMEVPDLRKHTEATERARHIYEEKTASLTLTTHTHELLNEKITEATTALEAWERITSTTSAVLRLSNLASAENASLTRIPLPTFVVQKRFESILERANEQLAHISLGRYSLIRTDEKTKGTRELKTGLGLAINDSYNEVNTQQTARSPKSLSGGETFYVSLSLALALAEIVQEENGGIQLDTLLIDEGFGSLDESTLQQVMSTLINLTKNGRAVGVVSHVSDLKEMIAERISTIPRQDGSSSLTVHA